jgi:hypothetical protein
MFEASVDGQLYDPARFGQYYRPYGVDAPATGATPAPAPTPAPTPAPAPAAPVAEAAVVTETVAEPVAQAPAEPEMATAGAPAGDAPSAQDILAAIRNRKQ